MYLRSFPNALLIFGLLMLLLLGIEQNIRCKDRVNQLSRRKPLEIKEMRLIHFAESSYIEYWTTKVCFEAFYGRVMVAKFLPILVSGVKDWPLEGTVRLLSPLRRTGTKGKELHEAD